MIVRSSQFEAFKFCPRFGHFMYDLGLRLKGDGVNPDLFFGKVLHKGTELFHNHSLDTALDYLRDLPWPQHATKTLGRANAFLKMYAAENPVKMLETEKPFTFRVGVHTWKGRWDGVGLYQGDKWVVENKTTIPYFLTLKPNDQMMAYWMGGKVYYQDVKGIFVNNFDIQKMRIIRTPMTIFQQDFDSWLEETKLFLAFITRCQSAGVYPTGASCMRYNSKCIFRKLCRSEPEIWGTLIKKCFVVSKEQKELDW